MRPIILLIILLPMWSQAQLIENFDDGNFSSNPVWQGDTASFMVNASLQLQLDDTAAGVASLYTDFNVASLDSMEWRFFIRLGFSPSSSNFGRIYLCTDQSDLSGSLNGYYLQFGEAGSNDAIELFYQSGSSSTSVARGNDGSIASSFAITVRVTRDANGFWNIFYDPAAGSNYQLDATGSDISFNSSLFFGIHCNYTSSNTSNFYFDDIYAGPIQVDTIAPALVSVAVVDSISIEILFDEAVDSASAENLLNYTVDNGIGNPSTAVRDGINPALVHLTFSSVFTSGLSNNISILNISDLNGNIAATINSNFTYIATLQPTFRDVIFNELHPDPNPVVGLPDAEFVELYNRSGSIVDLGGWSISDLSSSTTLDPYLFNPGEYLILCSRSDTALFNSFGKVLGLSSLPTLNNSGDFFTLRDNQANIIDSVRYDISWYRDALKQNGGWTLELINPEIPGLCRIADNWIASNDPSGGSPGTVNSVYDTLPDLIGPTAVNATGLNDSTILLCFNEAIPLQLLGNVNNYSISSSIGTPLFANSENNALCVRLTLASSMQNGTSYTVNFTGIGDCWGNPTANSMISFVFIKPEEAEPFDIVINEFFPDPNPPVALPEVEFIELYNRSTKNISLDGWSVSDGGSPAIIQNVLLLPDEYLIVCHVNDTALFSSYGKVIGTSSFPTLNNSGDEIFLFDNNNILMDYLSYDLTWYVDAGKSNGGFTLERIDPDFTCLNSQNWKASDDPSGGTPGKINSIDGVFNDFDPPELERASVLVPTRIRLHFSELMDTLQLVDPASYMIDNGIGQITAAVMESDNNGRVLLDLGSPLQPAIIYTILVSSTLEDCAGNTISGELSARFALPEPALPGDVIINEILFNPVTGGFDFVELYNLSNKILDLKNIRIANANLNTGLINVVQPAFEESYLFFPQEYIALTENRTQVLQQYFSPNPKGVITIPDLPSYNNDEGICVILDPALNELERFRYHEDMHFALLDIVDGVSLERIRFDDIDEWHSASSTVGFATPAYKNSQYSERPTSKGIVDINPEVFSPDNDGIDDILNISYAFNKPGFVVTVSIFDSRGRLKKSLVNNELVGISGDFVWDGVTDEMEKARVGIYIVYVEAFHTDGDVEEFKLPCVVAARF